MEEKIDTTEMRQQVMLSQFVYVAGCHPEQARQLLVESNWQFETAMSRFLQDPVAEPPYSRSDNPTHSTHLNGYQYTQLCTPANTPVTPPNFPDALSALARLSTGEVQFHGTPLSSLPESQAAPTSFAMGPPRGVSEKQRHDSREKN